MKNIYKIEVAVLLSLLLVLPFQGVKAGNKDRSGQAGASELLINPWARSSGWGGVNVANSRGLEAMYTNVAGTAFTKKTELIFSSTQWLKGSNINIFSFGFTQKMGESNVLGVSIMSMKFGDIPITQVDLPEGGIGNFSPRYMNINISFAKAFSNSIYGGFNLKIISEVISDISAQGVAIDAGIQYVTGEQENIKFGISLKNVGPTMKFKGDGFSIPVILPGHQDKYTVEHRSAEFELPSQLNIGAAYDINFSKMHRLTLAASFTSNSFTKDQYTFGGEYELKSYLMLRGAYSYEEGITSVANRTSVYTGPSAGITVQVPLNKENGSMFGIDYSYRASDPFSGTHSIGVRLNF
jgi:hypothetical protein